MMLDFTTIRDPRYNGAIDWRYIFKPDLLCPIGGAAIRISSATIRDKPRLSAFTIFVQHINDGNDA